MGGTRRQPAAPTGLANQMLTAMFGATTADAERARMARQAEMVTELMERRHQGSLAEADKGLAAALRRIEIDSEQYETLSLCRSRRAVARTQASVWRARQQALIAIAIVVLTVLAAVMLCGLSVAAWGLAP